MSDLADLMQDILGCVPGKGDRCLIHGNGWRCAELIDAERRVQEFIDAECLKAERLALQAVVHEIASRRRRFSNLGAHMQYLAALDDAYGIARNQLRAVEADLQAVAT